MIATLLAHTDGHLGTSFTEGFLHPLMGLDHLLAMISVGLISAIMGGHHIWRVPATFVSLLALGGIAGIAGYAINGVESWIALSLVLLGGFLVLNLGARTGLAYAAVAVFGISHGNPHGTELPLATNPALYVVGFMLASIAAHLVGIAIFEAVRRTPAPAASAITGTAGWALSAVGMVFLVQGAGI